MTNIQFIDLLLKFIGLIAIITGVFQLLEAKKRRMVDMYWKVAEMYSSKDIQKSRTVLSEIVEEMPLFKKHIDQKPYDSETTNQLIEEYKSRFHDAQSHTIEKQKDRTARSRIRFLNQIGVLVRKELIDRDMLFSLIGTGLEIDYPILDVIMKSHQKAHNFPKIYREVDYLFEEYIKWKGT